MMIIPARSYPSPIHSPLGNAETEDDVCGGEPDRQRDDKNLAAAHNAGFQNYILFERFQIALPPDGNLIILRGN